MTIDTRQIAARVRDAGVFAASSALLVQCVGSLLTPASDNAALWIYWTTGFAAGIALHLTVSGRRGV